MKLADNLYRYRFEYIRDDQRYDRLVREHDIMVQAILGGDEERAAQAAILHVENQRDSILDQIRASYRI